MRIAFDATAIPANRAGAGIYIFNLVQALAQIDRVHQYVVFAKAEHIAEFGIAQDNFEFVGVAHQSVARRLLWEQKDLPRLMRAREIDVLHSPHYTMPLRIRCRSVVTFHDMIFQMMPEVHGRTRRAFFQFMMRWSARHAGRIIAVSESTRQDVIRLLGVLPTRVIAVAEAASAAFRQLPASQVEEVCGRHSVTPGAYVYFVGVLEPRKNIPVLLEAFAKIAGDCPTVPLVIAGKKGWMYDAVFRHVTALGLQERVRFLGYVPENDLVGLYNGARVFVYPSLYEGFGLPVLEAMQCGSPVVTSNVSSMPEVAGNAALLVAPNDVDGLSAALRRLLSDDALARDLSQRGRERAKLFSWERCAQETLAVYEAVYEGV